MGRVKRGLNNASRFGGVGVREHDFADYAAGRTVRIVHEIEQATMDSTRFTGITTAGIMGITGSPTLPKEFFPAAAVKYNCNLMALTCQILADGTVATRALTMTVYGMGMFGAPIAETFNWSGVTAGQLVGKSGTKIFARVDKWVVESVSNLQANDVISIGVALGDGGVSGLTILPATPKFALPCRIKDEADIISCQARVFGMNAYVNYIQGVGGANVPTAWRLGEWVYQGVSLATATAKGRLIAAYDSERAGIDTHRGRLIIQQVTGLFADSVNLKQEEDAVGGAAPATVKATAANALSGAAGFILGDSTWDKTLNFRDYLGGAKMLVDVGNSAVTLSNLGATSDPTSIDAQGWQQLHWKYRIEIVCRSSVGVRSKSR